MKNMLTLSSALILLAATPTLAGEPAKTYRVEIPVQVRTEIYLERSKAKTARKADRLTGSNTFTKALERREVAKPRRYVRRYVRVRAREESKR